MEEIDADICHLRAPANFVITGATGSGKTRRLLEILKEWPFLKAPGHMLFLYNTWQELFEEFMEQFPEMVFIQGLHLEKIHDFSIVPDKVNVVICDDLMDAAVKSEEFGRLFTVYGHHKNIVNFFVTQNAYFKGPLSTTLNRNTHYFILLKTPHLNTLSVLNSQLYGGSGPLKEAFIYTMKEKPFNYLLVDVFNDSIQNRLRSNILESEKPMIIWRTS